MGRRRAGRGGIQENRPAVFANTHAVCLPSYYREGVPKVLIEAAACERPIVTTDMPGCREIVHDGVTTASGEKNGKWGVANREEGGAWKAEGPQATPMGAPRWDLFLVAGLQPCDALAARLLPRIHRGGFRDWDDGRAVWGARSGSEGAQVILVSALERAVIADH